MASNCCGVVPEEKVKRWGKTEREFINVDCPSAIKRYNQCMGGVDVCDQQMECYRTWFKTRKWTWKVILHFVDLAVCNSWFEYIRDAEANKVPKKGKKDLLKFKLEVAEALATTPPENRRVISEDEDDEVELSPIKRSKFYNPPAKKPCADKRCDSFNHYPTVDDITRPRKCRLGNCNSSSKTRCDKCNVYLCLSKTKSCFKNFH